MKVELNYIKAYRRLRELYQSPSLFKDTKYRMNTNPPKQAFGVGGNDECIVKSTNVMSAKTDNGVFTKIITIDDATSKKDEQIIYITNDMKTITHSNIGLTTLRCAMMSVLAVDLNRMGSPDKKVGFIGNGAINIKTAELLNAHFGIHNFVICGSKENRGKNVDAFQRFGEVVVEDTEELSRLNECDIIISCTNSCTRENLISNKELSNPILFVVQDSGYILDESFRQETPMVNYTDHPEQIRLHYKDEFPFDSGEHYFHLMEENYYKRKSVYLYGIAMADAIVFEEMYLC